MYFQEPNPVDRRLKETRLQSPATGEGTFLATQEGGVRLLPQDGDCVYFGALDDPKSTQSRATGPVTTDAPYSR